MLSGNGRPKDTMRNSVQTDAGQSWKQLVFYGEVVGFVVAWVVGIALLSHARTPDESLVDASKFDTYAEARVGELDHKGLK